MEDFELITPTQVPSSDAWKLPILYRLDKKGKESIWQIGFDGFDRLVMHYGKVGGKITIRDRQVIPKGKKNMQQQALQEARQRYEEQIRKRGYRTETGEVIGIPEPLLAYKWIPEKTLIHYPVSAQPKLDGIRCLASLDEEGVYLRSRNNKPFSFLQHIRDRVEIFLSYLPSGAILDGEFYSFVMNMQELAGLVAVNRKTPHPEEEIARYFIFDVILPENPPYADRYQLLVDAYQAFSDDGHLNFDDQDRVDDVLMMVAVTMAESREDLLEFHEEYVQLGYEGLMIRDPNAPYVFGRDNSLLKYKYFEDEEAIVIGLDEASGSEEGAAMLIVKDIRGNEIRIRFRGPIAERRRWYQNPDLIIGKEVTIRYQPPLTNDGKPRFPVGVAVRDYE